jgi:hypothetical protein
MEELDEFHREKKTNFEIDRAERAIAVRCLLLMMATGHVYEQWIQFTEISQKSNQLFVPKYRVYHPLISISS